MEEMEEPLVLITFGDAISSTRTRTSTKAAADEHEVFHY
jgi:hypothetical protein